MIKDKSYTKLAKMFLIVVFAFLFSSCATTISHEKKQILLSKEERIKKLSEINNFTINGIANFRVPNKSVTASLHWKQNGNRYEINVFGPLGFGAATIVGRPGDFLLKTQSQTIQSTSPEVVLTSNTGLELPVSKLHYWLKGLSIPKWQIAEQFDSFNRAIVITQKDWIIKYLEFVSFGQIDLPKKICIQHGNFILTIVINSWGF
jgi:outer membrane lipoprotein LolB